MATSPASPDRPPIQQLRTVAALLETPALARLYVHVVRHGPITVSAIVDELAVPQGTAYDYVSRLEAAGLVHRVRDTRPYEYEANRVSLRLGVDDDTRTITPAFIAAAARRAEDEDVDVFVDRHGLDGLAAALEYAFEYVDGTVSHRIAARELDVSPLEAEVILQALEPIAAEYADDTGDADDVDDTDGVDGEE